MAKQEWLTEHRKNRKKKTTDMSPQEMLLESKKRQASEISFRLRYPTKIEERIAEDEKTMEFFANRIADNKELLTMGRDQLVDLYEEIDEMTKRLQVKPLLQDKQALLDAMNALQAQLDGYTTELEELDALHHDSQEEN